MHFNNYIYIYASPAFLKKSASTILNVAMLPMPCFSM